MILMNLIKQKILQIISKLDNSLMIIHPPLKGKNQIFKISNKNLKK